MEELKPIVESMGYWKASTADGTTNPMFRCSDDTMGPPLHALQPPLGQELTGVLGLEPLQGAEPGNYRGIAITS